MPHCGLRLIATSAWSLLILSKISCWARQVLLCDWPRRNRRQPQGRTPRANGNATTEQRCLLIGRLIAGLVLDTALHWGLYSIPGGPGACCGTRALGTGPNLPPLSHSNSEVNSAADLVRTRVSGLRSCSEQRPGLSGGSIVIAEGGVLAVHHRVLM